jgi:hypothetical protein
MIVSPIQFGVTIIRAIKYKPELRDVGAYPNQYVCIYLRVSVNMPFQMLRVHTRRSLQPIYSSVKKQ